MKLCLALIVMLYSIAHAANTDLDRHSRRRAVVVARPPPTVVVARPPPTVFVRPGKRDVTSIAEMPPTSPEAESKRAVAVVRRPPTVVVARPGKRDMSKDAKSMQSPLAEFKRAAAKSVRTMKRDDHEMMAFREIASPVAEVKRRAIVVARPRAVVVRPAPTAVFFRPGKRDVSNVMKMQSPVEEAKRATSNAMNMQLPVEQTKRAVVLARAGKRDLIVPEAALNVSRIVLSLVTGKIQWSFGLNQRISCNMKERFGSLPYDLTIKLNDLHAFDELEKSFEYLGLTLKSAPEKFTFLEPTSKQPVVWSVTPNDIAAKLGFFIQDEACFKAIVSAVLDYKDWPVEFFLL